jgi:LysM domain
MNQRSSAVARALAVTALVAGFLVLVVVIAGSLGGGGSAGPRGGSPAVRTTPAHRRHAPASYVVQNGDTLTSIAHRTGVSVAGIQRLNPGVDPQILIAGEKLKLR